MKRRASGETHRGFLGVTMKRIWLALIFVIVAIYPQHAMSGPIEIILNPSPQEFSNTCQSYSLALSISLHPSSPIRADTAKELRELERKIRQEIVSSALSHGRPADQPIRDDWRAAVESVSSNALTLEWRSFAHLDPAIRFVADLTGISNPQGLGPVLALALVKTPALMSFERVETSSYTSSHIVTIFGAQVPEASMGDNATPKLLATNSAVKYRDNVKNVCASEDLADTDRYRAITTLTGNYKLHTFPGGQPFLITWVKKR